MAPASAVPVTTFLVPLSVDLLHIWGRGALSQGTINFLPTKDRSIPEGTVRVDITPHDYSTEALHSVNICFLEREANQRSIAILVSVISVPLIKLGTDLFATDSENMVANGRSQIHSGRVLPYLTPE